MRSLILRVSVMLAASVFGVTAKTMDDRGLGSLVERWADDPQSFLSEWQSRGWPKTRLGSQA